MSYSINEAKRSSKIHLEAITAIAAEYPDAYADGDYWVSPSLQPEACDALVFDGKAFRAGRLVAGKFVGLTWMTTMGTYEPGGLLIKAEREAPELYRALVWLIAGAKP